MGPVKAFGLMRRCCGCQDGPWSENSAGIRGCRMVEKPSQGRVARHRLEYLSEEFVVASAGRDEKVYMPTWPTQLHAMPLIWFAQDQ